MRRTVVRGHVLVAMVFLCSTGFVGIAKAAPVECGTVITQSGATVTLDKDVGPCTTTHGIIIRADNVTLNLNGFDVIGDATGATTNVGVLVQGTQNVVTDCSQARKSDTAPGCATGSQSSEVREFNAGVLIEGGSSNTVCRITARRNVGIGPRLIGSLEVGEGILVHDSNSNTIVNNTVDTNGPFGGITLLGDSDGNKVGTSVRPGNPDVDGASGRTTCDGGNTIVNNRVMLFPNADGIRIEPEAELAYPDSNTIENNQVTGSGLDGISAFFGLPDYTGATNNVIKSNTVSFNGFHPGAARKGDGIRLNASPRFRSTGANSVTVEGNSVHDNAAHGITVNSQNNNIKGNDVSGNGLEQIAHGINIRNDQNTTRLNRVSGNSGSGINISNAATTNEIKHNMVTGHLSGSGIRTEGTALQNNVMNNTAIGNGVPPLSFDLADHNPNAAPAPPCESNTWHSNDEVTKNQPCIN